MKGALYVVLALIFIGATLFYGITYFNEKKFADEYDAGIVKMSVGHYGDASAHFESLMSKYKHMPERVETLKEVLFTCYRTIIKNSNDLTIKQRQAVLEKIQEIDPASLTEHEKNILARDK